MPADSPDIPKVFARHAFICGVERPPGHPRGSCGAQGAKPLIDRLQARKERLNRPDIAVTTSGCFGFCAAGPVLVVYPEGVWYLPRTPDDIDAIVDTHLLGGELVERLVVVPRV
jgi:(2Fe-2S) ferredoxin